MLQSNNIRNVVDDGNTPCCWTLKLGITALEATLIMPHRQLLKPLLMATWNADGEDDLRIV